jgi:hypothetical protein
MWIIKGFHDIGVGSMTLPFSLAMLLKLFE